MTVNKFIPVDIVLAPEWWYKNTGITVDLCKQNGKTSGKTGIPVFRLFAYDGFLRRL